MMFYGAGVISAFLFGPKTTLHNVDESRVQIEKKKKPHPANTRFLHKPYEEKYYISDSHLIL